MANEEAETIAKKERILAIDISGNPGFAVADVVGGKIKLVHVDSVKTASKTPDHERYAYIESKAVQIIVEYGPFDHVCREHFTKGRNKRATQVVFGSWAAIDSALGRFGYTIEEPDEIVPSTVKLEVGGTGNASKDEVEDGVRRLYGLPQSFTFKSDDESDAAGIAYTYAKKRRLIK